MAPGLTWKRSGEIRKSAGLWLSDGECVLLLKRASWLDHPGTWTVPGGGLEPSESPMEAAIRETWEEVGHLPPHKIVGSALVGPFTCFFAQIDPSSAGWKPVLNEESTDSVWADSKWLQENWRDLHPGVQEILNWRRTTPQRIVKSFLFRRLSS